MQRTSESIGTLAAALAQAQLELTNPEKSLIATIRPISPRDGERTFRYASLSSGLDIVRKSLGKHEIATVQTTTIDTDASLVRLTTTLAHSSGEWMSSEWPVCPISETASPQRMGAALTYARRYALFTLVGIAGEDDLDAPNFADGETLPTESDRKPVEALSNARRAPGQPGNGQGSGKSHRVPAVPLDPEHSSALRERILAEISDLASSDDAADWARRILPAKNSLITTDTTLVEEAFGRKLSALSSDVDLQVNGPNRSAGDGLAASPCQPSDGAVNRDDPPGIDKSVLKFSAPRRYRNKAHLKFVAQQACLVCARKPPCDPHHLRFMQPRALGRKVSDEFAVPLCRSHHRAIHRSSDERAWWAATGIDPTDAARNLWQATRGTQPAGGPGKPEKSAPSESILRPAQVASLADVEPGL